MKLFLQSITNTNCHSIKLTYDSCVCGVRFVVHGLTTGESYVFRVQAANMFGLSEESQESSPISVEPALGEQTSLFIFFFACFIKLRRAINTVGAETERL